MCLLLAGLGAALFFLFAEEESTPPPARDLASVLDRATPVTRGEFAGMTEIALAVGDECVRLVVADSETERGQGLRGRSDLPGDDGTRPYAGMLFVYDADSTASYTMSGVTDPLDIGWYSRDGEPVDRAEMEPCPEGGPDCPLYSSDEPYRFALEAARGELPSGALGSCPS